jgi:hypothetical protein
MIITKRALPRRTFLRGMGATVALPFLDAMVPALSARAAKPAVRLGFVYIPNGTIQPMWVPSTTGKNFELSPILSPLVPVRDRITVLSGLAHRQADNLGDGNGDHARGTAVWLTGVHAWDRGRGGVDGVRLATTVDQIAAQAIGKDTRLPSLELSLESPTQIGCDSEDCFFSNTISWKSPTTPLPMEPHPRMVFERLFGQASTAAERRARIRKTSNILDSVLDEVAGLRKTLGSGDQAKLTEYLEAVREIEQRIQRAEQGSAAGVTAWPTRPDDIPESFEDYVTLMFDLQLLAYQADITRVTTLLMGRETSPRTFEQIGVPEQHHSCSHHIDNPELMARKAKIDQYHIALFGQFLEKMKATQDGDGNLLDHSMILYGGGLGNGNLHDHVNLPVLVAGRGAGTLSGGQHVNYPDNTPMANLLLTILDKAGVPTPEKIGDSTEHLKVI